LDGLLFIDQKILVLADQGEIEFVLMEDANRQIEGIGTYLNLLSGQEFDQVFVCFGERAFKDAVYGDRLYPFSQDDFFVLIVIEVDVVDQEVEQLRGFGFLRVYFGQNEKLPDQGLFGRVRLGDENIGDRVRLLSAVQNQGSYFVVHPLFLARIRL
jgi:hypothetical protein